MPFNACKSRLSNMPNAQNSSKIFSDDFEGIVLNRHSLLLVCNSNFAEYVAADLVRMKIEVIDTFSICMLEYLQKLILKYLLDC